MVPRETGRREFLFGAAGVAGVAGSGLDTPAVGLPDLHADHRLSWQFTVDDEDALLYPFARADGAVFAFLRRNGSKEERKDAIYAIDLETGEKRWKRATNNYPALEATADGHIYIRGQDGVQALDVADGSVNWEYQPGEGHLQEFQITQGTAFVVTTEKFSALDADGTERWQVPVGDPEQDDAERIGDHARGVTVADETVYIGTNEGFTALALADGERRWQVGIGEVTAWPAAVRDGLLVGWSNRAVYGIETADGTWRFRTPVKDVHARDIGGTVGERTAYVWGEQLTAVDLQTGEKRWTYADDGSETDQSEGEGFTPILSDGRVYTSTGNESVVALDADSGREQWQFESNGAFGYWGEVAGGYVYVAGERRVHVLDAKTGRQKWSLEVSDESTRLWVFAFGDSVFVGTRRGRLAAIDPPSRLVAAPVETAAEFATSSSGLGLLGLVGAGLLGVGYRRAKRRASAGGLGADPGAELGRLERLGGGPVTETYLKRVRTPDGPRLVAETRLTESTDANSELRRAFADAIERWADLDADGVLPIREYGGGFDADADSDFGSDLTSGSDPASRSVPWFETPFLAGGSLADSWPLDYRERVEIASSVARTLHAAHREEVVHGGLAPRHVFRGTGEEARYEDSAPKVRVGGWFLTDALAEVRGESDPYAPPESGTDEGKSVAGDVYRVGALAHHLLAGQPPDSGPDSEANLANHTALPNQLGAVLDRALAADPADRYDSALAFDDEFRWAALDR